jgi:hypothetical protein
MTCRLAHALFLSVSPQRRVASVKDFLREKSEKLEQIDDFVEGSWVQMEE